MSAPESIKVWVRDDGLARIPAPYCIGDDLPGAVEESKRWQQVEYVPAEQYEALVEAGNALAAESLARAEVAAWHRAALRKLDPQP